MHNRNIIYDEIAGLLIIYMVVYHIIQQMGLQNSIYMDTLSYIGKHSLIIYVIHWPILLLIYRVILPKSIC